MPAFLRCLLTVLALAADLAPAPVRAAGPDLHWRLDRAERIDADGRAVPVELPDWQRAEPGAEGPLERRYRWTLDLPDDGVERALYLAGLRGYARLRVNGHTVFDNRSALDGHLPRGADLPVLVAVQRGQWRQGRNVVEMEVLGPRALSVSPLEVGPSLALGERRRLHMLATVVGPVVVAAVIATLGASMLYLWRGRRDPIFAFFGAGMVGWGLHTVWTLLPTPLLPDPHHGVWWNTLYTAFVAMLVLFSVRFSEADWPRLERAVWLLVLATPWVLYAAAAVAPRSDFPAYWRLLLIGVVGVGVAAIVRAAGRAPSADRVLIAIIGLVSLGAAGHDWGTAMQREDNNPVYLVPYVGLLFGAFVMRVLIDRFLAASRQLETLNLSLEQRVAAQHLELREALAQMRVARDAAEAADRAKTRFLAAASHDLRQPAHALGLYVASLRGQSLTPQQADLADRIAGSVDALDAMFNALLDVSRIDSGAVTPRAERVDLAQLLRRLAEEFAPQAEARALRLVLRTGPGRQATRGDPLLLESIVRNLLANAVKYTERGGILLACRARRAADGQRRWRIEVWDSGHGIAPEAQERVFEEYYQIGNPARDRRQGLGLGLAIVRRLAQLMGLAVTLSSRPGRGSVFRLEGLAVADGADVPPGTVGRADARTLRGRTVALIEDDLDVCAAMRSLLGQWGCEVADGNDARAVLRRLGSRAADAVIADVRLAGGRDGPQEVQALQRAWGRPASVLIVTGETAPESVQRLTRAGLDWMVKPVAPERLQAWLIRALCRRDETPRGGLP